MSAAARSSIAATMAVAAATLLILAAILAIGRPTVFTDTDDYYALGQEIADAIVMPLTGHPADDGWRPSPADAAADAHMGRSQMAARSVAYAVLLYPAERLGTLWLLAAIQAALSGWVLWLVWRAMVPAGSVKGYVALLAALTAGTALPMFAGFAMPDIFAALAILMAGLLLTAADRLGRNTRAAVALLLAYAYAVHSSHVFVGVLLLLLAWPVLRWQAVAPRAAATRIAIVGCALALGVLVNAGYGAWVKVSTGEALRRPPFLVARLLADGPGRDYLRAACRTATPYALCRFKHAPLDDSDDILWEDPPKGIFNPSSYPVRMALEDEEARFVLGTLRYDPWSELRAALVNWRRQARLVAVIEPLHDTHYYLTDSYWKDTHLPLLIQAMGGCGRDGTGCRERLKPPQSYAWHGSVFLLSSVAVLAMLALRVHRGSRGNDRRLPTLAALVVAAVILNAAVCGILSGPFARYQARVAWLIPLLALLFLANRLTSGSLTERTSRFAKQ